MVQSIKPQFSNIQLELLKLYSVGVDDKDLNDLKLVMAKFFLDKLRINVDKIWEEKSYSDDFFKSIENG